MVLHHHHHCHHHLQHQATADQAASYGPGTTVDVLFKSSLVLPATLQVWWYYTSVQISEMQPREGKKQVQY